MTKQMTSKEARKRQIQSQKPTSKVVNTKDLDNLNKVLKKITKACDKGLSEILVKISDTILYELVRYYSDAEVNYLIKELTKLGYKAKRETGVRYEYVDSGYSYVRTSVKIENLWVSWKE